MIPVYDEESWVGTACGMQFAVRGVLIGSDAVRPFAGLVVAEAASRLVVLLAIVATVGGQSRPPRGCAGTVATREGRRQARAGRGFAAGSSSGRVGAAAAAAGSPDGASSVVGSTCSPRPTPRAAGSSTVS
jgi:hypothetical protein